MQGVGLAYWTLAAFEALLVPLIWNTSLVSSNSIVGIFMINFFLGLCGFSLIFIFGAYLGEPRPQERLLFNKEPFPRASGILVLAFALVALVLIVSTIKIFSASHGYSTTDPSATCAHRLSYLVGSGKWVHYKCVTLHEWLLVDKATALGISAGSSFILFAFGTVCLAMPIAKGRNSQMSDDFL